MVEPTLLATALGNRYRIERERGCGGMGTRHLARDRRLERSVALKVRPAEFTAVPGLRARFLRETRFANGFSLPNIVPVFAIAEREQVLAFTMGFVEGESLAARLAFGGPFTQREALRLLPDVSYALPHAHGRGVAHRDSKLDNLMIERATGRALVMHFGIARTIAQVPDPPGLTRAGEGAGTPDVPVAVRLLVPKLSAIVVRTAVPVADPNTVGALPATPSAAGHCDWRSYGGRTRRHLGHRRARPRVREVGNRAVCLMDSRPTPIEIPIRGGPAESRGA